MPTLIDRQEAVARLGGDIALLREVASIFLSVQDECLNELRTAAANRDLTTLSEAAHGLKGSVANFCATEAVSAAFAIERMGKRQPPPDSVEVDQALRTLELALLALRPELEKL